MQKVWDELKKIEAQADQIQADAQDKAKKITTLALQESDKLVANSKVYGEEESQKLYAKAVEEANQNRAEQLKANELAAHKLQNQAEKRMDKAVSAVVDVVLEETPA
jgi:vacuolar-type H+-ATPase subunit H